MNITKSVLMLFTLFMILFYLSCKGQNKTDSQNSDSLKLNVNIVNLMPIGWGVKYLAVIDKIIEGNATDFNDTIVFGMTASKENILLNIGSKCEISFYNTSEINKLPYLPSINGMVSKQNEIWLIARIHKINPENKRSVYSGTAVMCNGKPGFIWDMADSQVFYPEGLTSWDSKYLNRRICIEGVLAEGNEGGYAYPLIKEWKITGCE